MCGHKIIHRIDKANKMTKNRIFITGDFDIPEQYVSDELIHLRVPKDNEDIIQYLSGVTHYIVGGPEYINEDIMSRAPDLCHVVVMGTGISSFIDIGAAQARGIQIDNTPGINADSVAEFILGSIIFNLGNSFHSREELLKGAWYQKPRRTLSEAKIGIVGLGDIGTKLASKIRAISPVSEISYFARTQKKQAESDYGLTFRNLKDMAQTCDVLALCLTYNSETHHIIDHEVLDNAKNGIMLFNFSNPQTVDPAALKSNLLSGKIGIAFFDGYYDEWVYNRGQKHDRFGLLNLGPDKFVATSHIAGQTHGVIAAVLKAAFSKIEQWRLGERTSFDAPKNTL